MKLYMTECLRHSRMVPFVIFLKGSHHSNTAICNNLTDIILSSDHLNTRLIADGKISNIIFATFPFPFVQHYSKQTDLLNKLIYLPLNTCSICHSRPGLSILQSDFLCCSACHSVSLQDTNRLFHWLILSLSQSILIGSSNTCFCTFATSSLR